MKVLHLPFTWFPDEAGGTEEYVRDLCAELQELGVESVVAAPGRVSERRKENPPAWRFVVPYPGEESFLEELYGDGSPGAAQAVAAVLDEERPDVVHMHSYTRGSSLRTLREAKRRSIPVVFTYHTPTATCPRGTLLRWGTEVCDGALNAVRCGSCIFESHGAPRWLAGAASRLFASVEPQKLTWAPARIRQVAALPGRLKRRHEVALEFLRGMDRIIAPSIWVRELLERLGVAMEAITHLPQGVPRKTLTSVRRQGLRKGEPLELVVAGRAGFEKGLDLVPEALELLRGHRIRIRMFVAVQGDADERLSLQLSAFAERDKRLTVCRSVPRTEVMLAMGEADAVIVPSRCLETGPLVVLEAFASGTPIIAARLGGIEERVSDEKDGILFEAGSGRALAQAVARLESDRPFLERLRAGVRPPPSMADVASAMASTYREVVVGR